MPMQITDTVPSPVGGPRSKKRPGAQSPGPMTYELAADATAEAKERAMKDVMDDHKNRITVITQVLTVIGRRLDDHDQLMAKIGSNMDVINQNDADIKSKLGSLEDQVVANDQKLKSDLATFESKVEKIAQAVEAGVPPAQMEPIHAQMTKIEGEMQAALKGLEGMIQQVTAGYTQRDEELFARFQAGLAELSAKVAASGTGPAPQPSTTPPRAAHDSFGWTSGGASSDPWAQARGTAQAGAAQSNDDEVPNFPVFNVNNRSGAVHHHVGGDRKTLFEDKVAISVVGQYRDDQKHEWLESTRNYLISKAFEMDAFLRWAESAQATEITHGHIGWLSQSGFCADQEPHRLSRDLWGYLNLCLSGKQKLTFNNVPKGNGFEAWRRIVVPIAPRSEARLHEMHGDVHRPAPSKRLADVLGDIDRWEGMLVEFYRCGGAKLHDKTKVIVAMKMLPPNTPASLKMALKGIHCFETFKDELRQNIKFLEDFSGPLAQANVAEEYMAIRDAVSPTDASIPPGQEFEEPEEITEQDLPAFVMQTMSAADRRQLVLAVNQRRQQTRRQPTPPRGGPGRQRRPTPPRGSQDAKCANCGAAGHTAQTCSKPRIPLEERKCHSCGKTGHIASRCPDKQAKAHVAESASQQPVGRILMVTDDDGFSTVPFRSGRVPPPPTIGDFVRPPRASQGQRRRERANRFMPLSCACTDPSCDESRNHDDDASIAVEPAQVVDEQSPHNGLSAATRFIIGPDYHSECSKCDGSECDGNCGIADLRDFDEPQPSSVSLGPLRSSSGWEAIPGPVIYDVECAEASEEIDDAVSQRAGSNHSVSHDLQSASSPRTEIEAGSVPRGYLSISAEPNTEGDMRVELPSTRRRVAERIRTQLGPDRMAALEALDMADQVIDQALLMEYPEGMDDDTVMNVEWVDLDIEIALDSGACDHVMDVESDAPGYEIRDSASSRRGGCFIVGNGERVSNDGQAILNLETGGGLGQPSQVQHFQSVFQAARVTRPLMSVSRICSNGFQCVFDDKRARVLDDGGQEVCVFERKGGLYVSRMRLKSPSPFGGQAR